MANLCSIVRKNLADLVNHTRLSSELCTGLMARELVNQSEHERLIRFLNDGSHSEGAVFLYNDVLHKLSETCENRFIEALLEGRNYKAVEILRRTLSCAEEIEEGDREVRISLSCLLKSEVKFLKEIQNGNPYNSEGKFEGLHLEDEEVANELVSGRREWRLVEENLVGQRGEKAEEFVSRIKRTAECLQEGILWWNPKASRLPFNFVERRVQRSTSSGQAEDSKTLSGVLETSEPFLWLVDPPGMGKSTVTTKLEEEWRKLLPSLRIVVRLNLNLVQNSLQNEAKNEEDLSLSSFLQRFVPYIPFKSLSRFQAKVVVLLDGLDEVCPQHEDTMLRLLHSLLEAPPKETSNSNWRFLRFVLHRPRREEKLRLEKLFLTTRPHLKNRIQKEFGVDAHSLLPLELTEQIRFLSQTVSEVVEFSQEKAKKALSSIPFSVRSLMGNPLMLFLYAQVIKAEGSEVFDLYDLYERFMEAKHLLYVVEKEEGGNWNQRTDLRVKKMMDEYLQYYFACALKQLLVFEIEPERPCFPLLRVLPERKKLEELLSFGLILLNSGGQVEFAHRSFAEFFYARLLTSPDTSVALRDALFRQLYSASFGTSFAGENVEEFVLCVLKKRRAANPAEDWVLRISRDWLQRKEDRKFVLGGFLGGRLFPLLGEEILSSSVDFDLPEVADLLLNLCVTSRDKADFARWLTSRSSQWIRQTLFNLPAASAAFNWSNRSAQLASALFCVDPEGLARSLTQQEIFSALISCKNLIEIICGVSCYPKLESVEIRHRREIVESRMGQVQLKRILVSKESLETSTLKSKEAAWRLAEVFTKKELRSFISDEETRVADLVGQSPSKVKAVWGEDFLGNLVTFRFKFGKVEGRTLFEGSGVDFALDNLWGRLKEGTKGVGILREALLRGRDWSLLKKIEQQVLRRQANDLGEVNLVERVVGGEGNFLWDVVDRVPLDFLPYVVRYGALRHVKSLLQMIRPEDVRRPFYTQTFPVALLLSLLVDESDETFTYLVSFAKKSISLPNLSKEGDFASAFMAVGVDDLRKVLSRVRGQRPLMCQVSCGEFLLCLLPHIHFKVSEDLIKFAVKDFLSKSTHCDVKEVSEVFDLLLIKSPSLREYFLNAVVAEASRIRLASHTPPKGLLQFLLRQNGATFTELPVSSSPMTFLMDLISEFRCLSPQVNAGVLSALQEKVRSFFGSEKNNVHRLLGAFPSFRTEEEWELLLKTLLLIPHEDSSGEPEAGDSAEKTLRVYEDHVTPLLRLWLRHFGVEETRRLVEDELLQTHKVDRYVATWREEKCVATGEEAVRLAVDLGSVALLEEVGRPSLLSWRNEKGRNFEEVAVKKWGRSHEVSTFLQQKFQLNFNSDVF